MNRIYALLIAAPMMFAAQAQTINVVNTSPSTLTECTLVGLTISGVLPGGVSPTSFVPGTQVGMNIPITINTGNMNPGGPYSVNINLGPYPAGTYTFTVNLVYQGNTADTEVITRTILPGFNPDAGDYAEHVFCTSDPTVPLLSLLGGTPDPGGVWTDPFNNTVANGQFDPGVSPAGTYSYTWNVLAPCVSAFQTVLLTYLPNNDPGVPGTVQVCATGGGPNINLFSYLGGTPMMGGTWTNPNGVAHNGTYVPGVDLIGVYTYSVPGLAPCGSPTATVTVQPVQPPNAGQGSAAQVCYNDATVQLNQYVTGSPQTTGAWFDPSNFGLGDWTTIISALSSDPGIYRYVVYGGICPNDTAFVTLSFIPPPCTPGFEEFTGNVARFEVMPNPSEGHITLELELYSASGAQTLEVMNVQGQVVRSERLAFSGTWMRHDMDLSDLSKGAYMLRLTSADGRAVQRVMLR